MGFLPSRRYQHHRDDARSNRYNASTMYNTIKWGMIDQLRSPPPYFADVIHLHFKLRGNHIIAKVKEWVPFIAKWRGGSVETVNSMIRELEELINKL